MSGLSAGEILASPVWQMMDSCRFVPTLAGVSPTLNIWFEANQVAFSAGTLFSLKPDLTVRVKLLSRCSMPCNFRSEPAIPAYRTLSIMKCEMGDWGLIQDSRTGKIISEVNIEDLVWTDLDPSDYECHHNSD